MGQPTVLSSPIGKGSARNLQTLTHLVSGDETVLCFRCQPWLARRWMCHEELLPRLGLIFVNDLRLDHRVGVGC